MMIICIFTQVIDGFLLTLLGWLLSLEGFVTNLGSQSLIWELFIKSNPFLVVGPARDPGQCKKFKTLVPSLISFVGPAKFRVKFQFKQSNKQCNLGNR